MRFTCATTILPLRNSSWISITLRTPNRRSPLLPDRCERALRSRAHEPEPRRRGDCPVCGRTGEYQDLKGNLVEMVHDPLGLELLLNGTIRNQPVVFEEDRREVGGIRTLGSRFAVQQQYSPRRVVTETLSESASSCWPRGDSFRSPPVDFASPVRRACRG